MTTITIKRLSLKQPFANWVAVTGQKSIETRTWGTAYRGDILICSSLTGSGEGLRGYALGIVELYDVRPMTIDDEANACIELFPRAVAWLLRNHRTLAEPFPLKGSLGLRDLEIDENLLRFIKD